MNIENFKNLLNNCGAVVVTFKASCKNNNPFTSHYEINKTGCIFECYDYNKTLYPICNINDDRAMSDNFLLCDAIAIEPAKKTFLE